MLFFSKNYKNLENRNVRETNYKQTIVNFVSCFHTILTTLEYNYTLIKVLGSS